MKLAALALLLVSGVAHAEGERALSATLGWATFSTLGKATGNQAPPTLNPDFGYTLGASYEHAIRTDLALRAELAGGMFWGGNQKKQTSRSYAGLGDAGITFRFDVLKWVPYAFGGLGGVVSGGGPLDRGADFVVVVGGGVDYLLDRGHSFGGEVRIASFGGNITVMTIGIRGTTRWGYF